MFTIEHLPRHILYEILLYLDAETLLFGCSTVNNAFQSIVLTAPFLNALCKRRYGTTVADLPRVSPIYELIIQTRCSLEERDAYQLLRVNQFSGWLAKIYAFDLRLSFWPAINLRFGQAISGLKTAQSQRNLGAVAIATNVGSKCDTNTNEIDNDPELKLLISKFLCAFPEVNEALLCCGSCKSCGMAIWLKDNKANSEWQHFCQNWLDPIEQQRDELKGITKASTIVQFVLCSDMCLLIAIFPYFWAIVLVNVRLSNGTNGSAASLYQHDHNQPGAAVAQQQQQGQGNVYPVVHFDLPNFWKWTIMIPLDVSISTLQHTAGAIVTKFCNSAEFFLADLPNCNRWHLCNNEALFDLPFNVYAQQHYQMCRKLHQSITKHALDILESYRLQLTVVNHQSQIADELYLHIYGMGHTCTSIACHAAKSTTTTLQNDCSNPSGRLPTGPNNEAIMMSSSSSTAYLPIICKLFAHKLNILLLNEAKFYLVEHHETFLMLLMLHNGYICTSVFNTNPPLTGTVIDLYESACSFQLRKWKRGLEDINNLLCQHNETFSLWPLHILHRAELSLSKIKSEIFKEIETIIDKKYSNIN